MKGQALSLAVLILGSLILLGASLIFYAEYKLSHLVLGELGESFSTKVYGSAFLIDERLHVSPERLLERLRRLGYRKVESDPAEKGEYSWKPPFLKIHLRGFSLPRMSQPSGLAALAWRRGHAWEAEGSGGALALPVALEPELIDELSGPKRVRREPSSWQEIPETLKKAVVAVEDKRFYEHKGLDPRAMARAAWSNLAGKGGLQGASTITQQLAKNYFLTPERSWRRKIAEAVLALYLERRYDKQEILTLYLNHIYMGQDGSFSVAGVKAAAFFYFSKELQELSLDECAVLAGIIRSPYRYNPLRDPARSKLRRDFVLERMHREGMITREELDRALQTPLRTKPSARGREDRDESAYYVAEVVRRMLPKYGEDAIFRYGLSIYTAMDPLLQKAAWRAVRLSRHQGALTALDAQNGNVLAIIGGKNFRESQFNRATQALRQPGSAFKPFVYGAALEKGFTTASLLQDTTRQYEIDAGSWAPKNFDEVYLGTTTLREALARSLNSATLDLAEKVGPRNIVPFAQKMGITSPLEQSLALALGASEVSLLELTAAYAPFANGGFRVQPVFIEAVRDAEGNILESADPQRAQVLNPTMAFLITAMLESVVQEGTASILTRTGWERPAAGKTGTTDDGRDAWFIGYTPELLAGAWVGEDQNVAIHVAGARDALPIWRAFMEQALADIPPSPFAEPAGLVTAKIDPMSGLLARSGCPQSRKEVFLEGTQPSEYCPLHVGGLKGWFKRFFWTE